MSARDVCYAALEHHFLTFAELASIPVAENGAPMIAIGADFSGKVLAIDARMNTDFGGKIFVRSDVVPMLEAAQRGLRTIKPDCDLEVVYGYRHLEIQREQFQAQIKRVLHKTPALTGDDLKEAAHRFSAVPEVAGHPTGGAVDVRIRRSNGDLVPMGTASGEYSMDTYVFSPFIGRAEWHNRQILRYCMLIAGFAPFDGEWWHFSYGDREWARYYNKRQAIYQQLRFSPAPPHDS